jgi:hypothetical protein
LVDLGMSQIVSTFFNVSDAMIVPHGSATDTAYRVEGGHFSPVARQIAGRGHEWQKSTDENGETVYTRSIHVNLTPEMLERLLADEGDFGK